MKYNQPLKKETENKLDTFVERIKNIKWFQPQEEINKEEVEKEVAFYLSCFGFTASVEYRELNKKEDWESVLNCDISSDWALALSSALALAWDSAVASSTESAYDSVTALAWDLASSASRDSGRISAWALENILVEDVPGFKEKYPNGTFKNIIPIWEKGLYPIGIVEGKFIIYVPKQVVVSDCRIWVNL